jgi:hypothetical protein
LSKLRRQKYHILAQPLSFYLAILRRFLDAGLGNIWVVYRDDKPIASAVLLHHGVGVYDKMGVSDEEHLNVRPNNFLLWEAIQHGHGHGFEFLDMGLSQIDYTGLIRFKESVGGIASAINYYRYTPPAFDVVRETNIKRLLSSLTDFLVKSDLPTPALEPAAALLYRYFS